MLTLAPVTGRRTTRGRSRAAAPRPTLAVDPPGLALPACCHAAASVLGAGEAIVLTTDVVDDAGTLLYRLLDRFVREGDGFRWMPNVGAGIAPTMVLQITRPIDG